MRSFPFNARQTAILGCGLAISLMNWIVLQPWDLSGWMIGAPFGRDYVGFWLAPRMMLAGQEAQITDLVAFRDAVMTTFGLAHDPNMAFVYPPHALLFLVPLAELPFPLAVSLWAIINLAALAATLQFCGGRNPMPRSMLVFVVLSPAAAAMTIYGHFGGLLALGSTLAITESERRPWLAGLCLACLTVKPQFACLLGLVLLFGGRWRCLLAAAAGTLALVGLSVAAFGIDPWWRFVTIAMPFHSANVSEFRAEWIATSVTPYVSARFFGLPAGAAWVIQAIVAIGALGTAVAVIRNRQPGPAMLTVVLVAVIVSQPYAAHYDLAAVAPALTLLVMDEDRVSGWSSFALLVWLLVSGARSLVAAGWPILSVLLVALLWVEGRRLFCGHPRKDSVAPRGESIASALP